jgi:two-component system response regulator YesN
LRQSLVDLFALLKFIANEKNMQQAHLKHWHQDLLKAIDLLQPIHQIKSLFLETCRELLSSKTDRSVTRKEIQMVMDYIHAHYAEDITIVKLSNVLCISTNYLSNLFRQETGIQIIEYLNRYRIDRATKLLRDPTLKVYEVAERTGFQDTSYFCKVFKGIEGTTVTDYKRQVEHH